MQSLHFDGPIGRVSLKRTLNQIKRLVLSCLCLENCRMCGRELSLSFAWDERQKEAEENRRPPAEEGKLVALDAFINRKSMTRSLQLRPLKVRPLADIDLAKAEPMIEPARLVDRPSSSGRILKRQTGMDCGSASDTLFERTGCTSNLAQPGRGLSPDAVPDCDQGFEPPKNVLAQIAHFALSAICVEAVRPALLKTAGCRSYYPRFSECLCCECWDNLLIDLPLIAFCPLTAGGQSSLAVASGAAYEGKLKDLIGEFKYEGERLLAQDLACVMVNAWSALQEHIPARDLLIVPVPLHWQRRHNRGFNQFELLAKELSAAVGAPVSQRALKRTKSTKPQQKLGKTERLANVRGAFSGNAAILEGKSIVFVDDVCTSGATLVECAEEALRCGARSVAALTVARAVLFASAA